MKKFIFAAVMMFVSIMTFANTTTIAANAEGASVEVKANANDASFFAVNHLALHNMRELNAMSDATLLQEAAQYEVTLIRSIDDDFGIQTKMDVETVNKYIQRLETGMDKGDTKSLRITLAEIAANADKF